MDNELFELCKEVYKRTGWVDESPLASVSKLVTLYTSDYLLAKLPGLLDIDGMTFSVSVQSQVAPPNFAALYTHTSVAGGKLVSHSTRFINVADTPLKALLKLTLALHEAGELSNKESEEWLTDFNDRVAA